jgi:hypothetical protein
MIAPPVHEPPARLPFFPRALLTPSGEASGVGVADGLLDAAPKLVTLEAVAIVPKRLPGIELSLSARDVLRRGCVVRGDIDLRIVADGRGGIDELVRRFLSQHAILCAPVVITTEDAA